MPDGQGLYKYRQNEQSTIEHTINIPWYMTFENPGSGWDMLKQSGRVKHKM